MMAMIRQRNFESEPVQHKSGCKKATHTITSRQVILRAVYVAERVHETARRLTKSNIGRPGRMR